MNGRPKFIKFDLSYIWQLWNQNIQKHDQGDFQDGFGVTN